jgi:hypothetical protein
MKEEEHGLQTGWGWFTSLHNTNLWSGWFLIVFYLMYFLLMVLCNKIIRMFYFEGFWLLLSCFIVLQMCASGKKWTKPQQRLTR